MGINETKQIEPKLLPFKCPVCNGWGTLGYRKQECHACKGRGYILVDQAEYDELKRVGKDI